MEQFEKPVILINFKQVNGAKAVNLARELERLEPCIKKRFDVVLALQPQDAVAVSDKLTLPVFIQDIFTEPDGCFLSMVNGNGSSSGNGNGDWMKNSTVRGVLLNHPQRKLPVALLEQSIDTAQKFGLKVMLCASTLEEGFIMNDKYKPYYLAVENERLIGKDVSLCTYCPEMVKEALAMIDNRVLFGGGIKSRKDLTFILNQGGFGILVASLILKAENPLAALGGLLDPNFSMN